MTIDNCMDLIDSRDVTARIEELEDERQGWVDEIEDLEDGAVAELRNWDNGEEAVELAALKDLVAEASDSPDWEHGETLVRATYFETYAQDLAEDLGYINRDVSWPYTCIDWERAANELKTDYIAVDFDGVEYLIRA